MEDMKIKLELPDVANEALKPLAQSIGNTLNSIWNICFGWIDYTSDKYWSSVKISDSKFLNNS